MAADAAAAVRQLSEERESLSAELQAARQAAVVLDTQVWCQTSLLSAFSGSHSLSVLLTKTASTAACDCGEHTRRGTATQPELPGSQDGL